MSVPEMQPSPVPSRGWSGRWHEVIFDLALSAFGAVLAWGAFTQVPEDVVPIRVLAFYTAYAVGATVVLAVARAATQGLPTLRQAERDGVESWLVRSWPGDWWHTNALDLGLAVTVGVLTWMSVRAGDEWLVASLALAGGSVCLSTKVGLALLGRRSNEAMWLTAESVTHVSTWGRTRCARTQVAQVAGRGSRVILLLNGPAERRPCPRPWRTARHRTASDVIVLDCSRMGHRAEELAEWMRSELALA